MINTPVALGDARFFAHEAMKTTFTMQFANLPEEEAKGVARECFELVDRLEESLSRFWEGGEVWRVNHMQAGQTLYLSDACHRCLLKAMAAYQQTGGLFDVTLGRRIQHHKDEIGGPMPTIEGSLVVHPDVAAVSCESPGRELDLGGIGKGFALDEIAILLNDWEVGDVLLAAGASSMLAVGGTGWPVELADAEQRIKLTLSGFALSASGTDIQGGHIVHPGSPADCQLPSHQRVWVTAPDAASAEVWSTALMLVPEENLQEWLAEGGDYREVFLGDEKGIRRVFPF